MLLERNGTLIRQGIFSADVVDTTGAGDCFTAAYAVALVEGRAAADRLRFAAAAAAVCVSRLGAMPSMPNRAEVEAVLGYDRKGGRSALA
jgi:ribokinase